jgi:hypothetical protein
MDQWFEVATCIHCRAILYELHYPTTNGWASTGKRYWKDDGYDCQHQAIEATKDEVHSRPNN